MVLNWPHPESGPSPLSAGGKIKTSGASLSPTHHQKKESKLVPNISVGVSFHYTSKEKKGKAVDGNSLTYFKGTLHRQVSRYKPVWRPAYRFANARRRHIMLIPIRNVGPALNNCSSVYVRIFAKYNQTMFFFCFNACRFTRLEGLMRFNSSQLSSYEAQKQDISGLRAAVLIFTFETNSVDLWLLCGIKE